MSLVGNLAITVLDDSVEFVFTVENPGPEPVTLKFRSGKTADVVVYDGDTEVWRWSDGRMFTQAIRTQTIVPDESFTNVMVWEEPSPGRYVAVGSLEITSDSIAKRAVFEVPLPGD